MRIRTACLAAVAAAVVVAGVPGVAQATNWVTVGPYPTQESCQPDMERYHRIYPAWGCYQAQGGWYFQYNRV